MENKQVKGVLMTSLTLDIDRASRVGMADAKANLSGLIAEVERTGEPYIVMRYNRPAAVISPVPQERVSSRTARGFFADYADPELAEQEQGAWERAVVEKYQHDEYVA